MPRIIGHEEQQKALKEISAALKELSVTNKFLSVDNPAGKYTISFTDSFAVRHSCIIYSENKKAVDELALNHKERVKAHILSLAEEYRIALAPEEQAILDNDFNPDIIQGNLAEESESSISERNTHNE